MSAGLRLGTFDQQITLAQRALAIGLRKRITENVQNAVSTETRYLWIRWSDQLRGHEVVRVIGRNNAVLWAKEKQRNPEASFIFLANTHRGTMQQIESDAFQLGLLHITASVDTGLRISAHHPEVLILPMVRL